MTVMKKLYSRIFLSLACSLLLLTGIYWWAYRLACVRPLEAAQPNVVNCADISVLVMVKGTLVQSLRPIFVFLELAEASLMPNRPLGGSFVEHWGVATSEVLVGAMLVFFLSFVLVVMRSFDTWKGPFLLTAVSLLWFLFCETCVFFFS